MPKKMYIRSDIIKLDLINILDDPVKPIKKIPELANGLNLSKHMAEHIYMFSGESINAKLKTTPGMMGKGCFLIFYAVSKILCG